MIYYIALFSKIRCSLTYLPTLISDVRFLTAIADDWFVLLCTCTFFFSYLNKKSDSCILMFKVNEVKLQNLKKNIGIFFTSVQTSKLFRNLSKTDLTSDHPWPTHLPKSDIIRWILTYLPTLKSDVICGCSLTNSI